MFSWIKKQAKWNFRQILPEELEKRISYIGFKNTLQYFLIQRVLRINSHVPWPVHWSSIVICPERIERNHWRPYPGYMPGQYIQALNGIRIGKNVRLGPGVKIVSANHNPRDYSQHMNDAPIIIGDNCWIAANSVILPGVQLGNHVVVAAGSVVTKSYPADCLIGGVPAAIIHRLDCYEGDPEKY